MARYNLVTLRGSVRKLASDPWQSLDRRDTSRWPRPMGRRWIAIALAFVGVLLLLYSFGAFSWLSPVRILGLAAITVGVSLLYSLRTDSSGRES